MERNTLRELKVGESATITAVGGKGAGRQHFLDMGMIPGTTVTLVKLAPMGDPMELRIYDYELTLRLADAEKISVTDIRKEEKKEESVHTRKKIEHPGLGEGGKYHEKETENPLPKGETIHFALAGNQNCGKTTLFNQLTGANRHVGNFPGVTVDRKDGTVRNHPEAVVTDLPGIYSLSPYSDEEIVSRKFILDGKPQGIINIVDATNIERNLYLTLQLMELEVPMVLALNMMDEMTGNGGAIIVNEMESRLGVPVVPISAAKNEGVDELISHALHVATYQEKPRRVDFCDKESEGGAVHRGMHGIMHLIEDHAQSAGIPVRFATSKLIEGDKLIEERLNLSENEKEMVEHIILQLEEERGLDRAAAIADTRFAFIREVCEASVVRPKESKEHKRSENIDKILTGKYTAIPSFIAIMALVFFLTFNVIGAGLQTLCEMALDWLTERVSEAFVLWDVSEIVRSLVIDGIFTGVGTVLSFVPIIVVLFFFLSMLEDSGYMARVAFVMDTLLRKVGLSGKSIVPMLIGFGCTVPGVMSTRTLSSERDRKMTVLLTPFMSCSAKLPIYGFLANAFFPDIAWLVMISMYLIGMAVGILIAYISKLTVFKGEAVPFVMELPNYRLPGAKNVLQLLWEKTKDFLKKAFTVILIATIAIWFLQTFNFELEMVESEKSILSVVAGFIAPIFAPLGLGDYRIVTALISGFMAKESVVSTLIVLYGGAEALSLALTPVAGFALLVFCLLYTPCIAAVTAIRKELGTVWMLFTVIGQCAIAWLFAFLVSLVGFLL